MTERERCYIFDIDGTIADNSHRTHHLHKKPKDWDAYHAGTADDKPHGHIVNLARDLGRAGTAIIFCTGRHEALREITLEWLYKIGVFKLDCVGLYMRKNGDLRPDDIVKLELLDRIIADGFEPLMAFDDRNSVVKMWRDAGIPCAQVAEGDF